MQGIKFLFVGKTEQAEVVALMEEYRKRLSRFVQVEVEELPATKATKGLSEEEQKQLEGTAILKSIGAQDCAILLDEHGKEYTSVQLSRWVEKKMLATPRKLVLVIGGPYGFSEEVYAQCPERLSLSKLTFNHQMVRAFLLEQIYRAYTIIHHHPYHHE